MASWHEVLVEKGTFNLITHASLVWFNWGSSAVDSGDIGGGFTSMLRGEFIITTLAYFVSLYCGDLFGKRIMERFKFSFWESFFSLSTGLDWSCAKRFVCRSISVAAWSALLRFWKAIINQLILLLILSIFPINKETLMDLQFYNEEWQMRPILSLKLSPLNPQSGSLLLVVHLDGSTIIIVFHSPTT